MGSFLSRPVEDFLETSSLRLQSIVRLSVCSPMCKGGGLHVNAKCNCRSRPALVIESIFVAECEREHSVLKTVNILQHKNRDNFSAVFPKIRGLMRKNANWIVFASTASKWEFLETFYGYSKLKC